MNVARQVQRWLSMFDQARHEPRASHLAPISNAYPVRWVMRSEHVERPGAQVHERRVGVLVDGTRIGLFCLDATQKRDTQVPELQNGAVRDVAEQIEWVYLRRSAGLVQRQATQVLEVLVVAPQEVNRCGQSLPNGAQAFRPPAVGSQQPAEVGLWRVEDYVTPTGCIHRVELLACLHLPWRHEGDSGIHQSVNVSYKV